MISASVWTVETTSPRLRPATMKCVESSSANRDWCATASRSATPNGRQRGDDQHARAPYPAARLPSCRPVKITGERVVSPAGGFNPTWQRHVAAYALAEPELGAGRVLDLGCGVGHSFHLLAPRETVGVDLDADALAGQDRETVVADMRALPFADGELRLRAVRAVARARPGSRARAAEAARVLEPGRRRRVRDAEPADVRAARRDHRSVPLRRVRRRRAARGCARARFDASRSAACSGSARYMELFDEERAQARPAAAARSAAVRRAVPVARAGGSTT